MALSSASMNRDAAYAYNHIVEPKMLLWIISAARVSPKLVTAARRGAKGATSMPGKPAIVRKHVPWQVLALALWRGFCRMPHSS